MKPLSQQNIESELSYAYLHAVASRAGVACQCGGRHDDNAGIDAKLTGWGPFSGFFSEVNINVQLKATIHLSADLGDKFSYSLVGVSRYNDLCLETVDTPRILVVLFLPENSDEWLSLDDECLVLRKCAYWVSLRGASPSNNKNSQTVYLPKNQRFDPEGLNKLMDRLSTRDFPIYEGGGP